MIRIRASSVGKIMTEPKAKTEILSVGAKTYLNDIAKEFVYGYHKVVTSKTMEKGTQVEDDSIDLLNSVLFTSFQKNTERRNTDFLTGECDIVTADEIIDIKSAWDLSTFPAISEDAHDKDYEWQVRAYMHLWDKPKARVAYCLVDTPDELINYEQADLHYVNHLPAEMRVTFARYERDMELEQKIIEKCRTAQQYVVHMVEKIKAEHSY